MNGKVDYKMVTSGALTGTTFRNRGTNTQKQVLYFLEKSQHENNYE
jgi:hypothetical protein